MLKAIFWDSDGVLANTEELYFEANRIMLADLGIELTPGIYRRFFLLQSSGIRRILSDYNYSPEKIEQLRTFRSQIYEELLATRDLSIAGASDAVRELSSFLLQAVVTSAEKRHFSFIHQQTGLLPYFDFVLAHGDYRFSKPEPDPYLAAIEKCGCSPAECLAVEDSERGLLAAKAAGLCCWIIPSRLTAGANFSSADLILSSIDQVPTTLRALNLLPEKKAGFLSHSGIPLPSAPERLDR